MSHTSGPWTVEDPMSFELAIVEEGKMPTEWGFIACLPFRNETDPQDTDFPRDVVHANARLISAAPDLLEALKAMDAALSNGFDSIPDRYAGRIAVIAARAAIAKAEGKS